MPRPPHKPTDLDRQFVERAVIAGSDLNSIAECLNICDDTLRKHYKYEICTGRERIKANAVAVVVAALEDHNLDAAKYVLSRLAGWVESSKIDHTSKDGSMTPSVVILPEKEGVPNNPKKRTAL